MHPVSPLRRVQRAAFLVAALCFAPLALGQAETRPAARPFVRDPLPELKGFKPVVNEPKTPDQLRAVQDRVEVVTRYALPAIVNIQINVVAADGSFAQEQ